MKPPRELEKHLNHAKNDANENALVKMRTLLGWMARIYAMLPTPSRGLNVRRSMDGDVWTVPEPDRPWAISDTGRVSPATVGGVMPTLGGGSLDTTSNTLNMNTDGPVWLKLTFTVGYTETYLSSWTLDSAEVDQGASLPTDTDAIKYLQFNALANSAAGASYFSGSIPILLADAGPGATSLIYS